MIHIRDGDAVGVLQIRQEFFQIQARIRLRKGVAVKIKQVMSVRDMDLLIRTELSDDRSVENGYRAFLESLDGALSSAVQEMGAYEGTDNLADAAVHFGLLSYAAGLVSRQYVAQLRARTEPAGKPDKAEAKKAAKNRKERKD